MKQIYLSTADDFQEIDQLQAGAWINLVNPSQEESVKLAQELNIDITDLRAPLDVEESSRVAVEDNYTLIIVDVPVQEERNHNTYYVTIPLGIIVTKDLVITTCVQELPLFENFFNRRVKNFYTFMKTRLVFQLLYRNAELFLTALRSIDRQTDRISAHIERATRNEQVIDMMELEKSVVYLKASLKMNDRVVRKLAASHSSLKKYPTDEELLEDTLVESQQAIEMADIYGNILSALTETSAAIIANNQNDIMKTLALMTIALDIPTVVFSAYGINVGESGMPFAGQYNAFWFVVLFSALLSLVTVLYFIKNKWF